MAVVSVEAVSRANDRCAVVIGVGKTGDLVPLESPVTGAEEVASLFRRNKYDVELLTDDKGPVVASQVAAAVIRFINGRQHKGYWLNGGQLLIEVSLQAARLYRRTYRLIFPSTEMSSIGLMHMISGMLLLSIRSPSAISR